ncbi:MAG: hypothetical protein U0401_05270 [Anaerolineae bacterium]
MKLDLSRGISKTRIPALPPTDQPHPHPPTESRTLIPVNQPQLWTRDASYGNRIRWNGDVNGSVHISDQYMIDNSTVSVRWRNWLPAWFNFLVSFG